MRHRREQTLLYQIVKQHCPRILAQLAAEDRFLLEYVQQQFTDYLKCGHLEHGFVRVRYELKTPYSIGTTHVIFEPMVFIARLATLVPKSRVNLTCLHSVFVPQQHTPNSRHTSQTRQGTKTAKATSLRWENARTATCIYDLDAKVETCVQHRYRSLWEMPRPSQEHCLCGKPVGHWEDSKAS